MTAPISFPLTWSGCVLYCGHIRIGQLKEQPFAAGAGPGPWFGSLGWGYPCQYEDWFDSEESARETLMRLAAEFLSTPLTEPKPAESGGAH